MSDRGDSKASDLSGPFGLGQSTINDAFKKMDANRSITIADRRRRMARLVLLCDPAMLTALEGIMGVRG